MAIGPGLLFLLVDHALAGAEDLLFVGHRLPGVLLGEEIEIGLAHRLGRIGKAELGRHRLADADEPAGGVLEVDIVGQVVHDSMEQVAFLLQRGLDALAVAVRFRFRPLQRGNPPPGGRQLVEELLLGLFVIFHGTTLRPSTWDKRRPLSVPNASRIDRKQLVHFDCAVGNALRGVPGIATGRLSGRTERHRGRSLQFTYHPLFGRPEENNRS
jgi:hypothetical protein